MTTQIFEIKENLNQFPYIFSIKQGKLIFVFGEQGGLGYSMK